MFSQRLPLGSGGLTVSPFCLGVCSAEVVELAFALGINFFFVSLDLHWPIYEGLRRGLGSLLRARPEIRSQIVVAGVSYTESKLCIEGTFDLLRAVPELEYIDIFIAGGVAAYQLPARLDWLRWAADVSPRPILKGASFHDRRVALDWMQNEHVDLAFVRYNPAHPGAEEDIFSHLSPQKKCLLFNFLNTHAHRPEALAKLDLAPHLWRPDWGDHYRFVLTPPAVDGSLFACHQVSHLTNLQQAIQRGPLTDKQCAYMKKLALLISGKVEVVT